MEKASVSVKIYNSTYALTTSASEEQVLKIAAEVDRRMQELAESKKLLQTDKIAIWTALDLAADRLELQEKCVALKQEMQQQSVAAEQKCRKNALRWSRSCSKSAQQQSRKCRKNMLRSSRKCSKEMLCWQKSCKACRPDMTDCWQQCVKGR